MGNYRTLRRFLMAVPFVVAMLVGTAYMASNTIPATHAGVATYKMTCTTTAPITCHTNP